MRGMMNGADRAFGRHSDKGPGLDEPLPDHGGVPSPKMGLHCCDCIFGTFVLNEERQLYQGRCDRGYTLADPHLHTVPEMYFCERPEGLVPVIDPCGHEYLRTSNVCGGFVSPQDAADRERGRRHHFWER